LLTVGSIYLVLRICSCNAGLKHCFVTQVQQRLCFTWLPPAASASSSGSGCRATDAKPDGFQPGAAPAGSSPTAGLIPVQWRRLRQFLSAAAGRRWLVEQQL